MQEKLIRIFDAGDYHQRVESAAMKLREGGIVILPTETVYGAAAALSSPAAVARLRDLPPPASPKPFVLHLARAQEAADYLDPVSEMGHRLMRKLWPGPVALVFDVSETRRREVAARIGIGEGELYDGPSITLRCPDQLVTQDILGAAQRPIVVRRVPADPGGMVKSPLIPEEWGQRVDLAVDAGPTRYQRPSTVIRLRDDRYEIVRGGVYDDRIIERLLRTTILFVCSGNTCRSPLAEAIARDVLARGLGVSPAELEARGWAVLSAGALALPGARATPAAVDAAKELGLDLSQHRSRPLTAELVHQADVIYTMSRNHAAAVKALSPSAWAKVRPLDPARDIEDPIGGDLAVYRQLAAGLRGLIEARLKEESLL